MKYQNILFDLDRTLWDFEKNNFSTFKELYEKYNISKYCKFDEFYKTYRSINESLWKDYRENKISKDLLSWKRFELSIGVYGDIDENTAKSMSKDYIEISPTKTNLFPGSIELLEYLLVKNYNLFIITNGFKEVQYKKVELCNIQKYFKRIFTSEETGYNKPDIRFFNYILKEINTNSEECLIIGDDPEVDIKGAILAKIDSIWVNYNNNYSEYMPTYTVKNLLDIKNIL